MTSATHSTDGHACKRHCTVRGSNLVPGEGLLEALFSDPEELNRLAENDDAQADPRLDHDHAPEPRFLTFLACEGASSFYSEPIEGPLLDVHACEQQSADVHACEQQLDVISSQLRFRVLRSARRNGAVDVERVARGFIALQHRQGIEAAVALGEYLFRELHGGQASVSKTSPRLTYRQLSGQLEALGAPSSPTALHQYTQVYLMLRTRDISGLRHLTLSHARLLTGLPPEAQQRLIGEVESKRWSVRTLETEVARLHGPKRRGGRPRKPMFAKTLHRWRRDVEKDALLGELEQLPRMTREQRKALRDTALSLNQNLVRLIRLLEEDH